MFKRFKVGQALPQRERTKSRKGADKQHREQVEQAQQRSNTKANIGAT